MTLCILAAICAGLHAFAAMTSMKNSPNKTNDLWMIIGALIVLAGVILCWFHQGADWLAAVIGFGLIAYVAIQNGKKKKNMHVSHHIVRISILIALSVGFVFL